MQSELYPKRCRPAIPQGEQAQPSHSLGANGHNTGGDVIPLTTRLDDRYGLPGHNSDNPAWRADNDPDELNFDQIVARNQQHGIVLAHLNGALAVMVDPRCEPSHRIIYKELALHRNVFGISFPGFRRLAQLTEYSEGKVRNVISDLIQWKHIISDRRAPGAGGRALAHYTPTPRFGLDLEALLTAFAKELKAKGDQKSKRCSAAPSEPKPADVSLQGDVRSHVTHQGDISGLMSPPQGDVRGLMSPCRVHSKVVVAVEGGTNAPRIKVARSDGVEPGSISDNTAARVPNTTLAFLTDEQLARFHWCAANWRKPSAMPPLTCPDRAFTDRNLANTIQARPHARPEDLRFVLEETLGVIEAKIAEGKVEKPGSDAFIKFFNKTFLPRVDEVDDQHRALDVQRKALENGAGAKPAFSGSRRSPAKQGRAVPVKPIDTEALRRAVELEELGGGA